MRWPGHRMEHWEAAGAFVVVLLKAIYYEKHPSPSGYLILDLYRHTALKGFCFITVTLQ